MPSEVPIPLDRLVVRNALAHHAWVELRIANVLPHERYTSETLADLADFIDRDECVSNADGFSEAVLGWLRSQELLDSASTEKDATQIAREVWAEISDYLRTPLPAGAITQGTVQAASEALVYYVHAWNLPLNPENLDEMAYAMLARLGLESATQDV